MKSIYFWIPILLSLALTPFALELAMLSGGFGHGNYFLAKILFPYTMFSTVFLGSITIPFIILAIVQFPLYGLALAFAVLRKKFKFAALCLFATHLFAVLLCVGFIGSSFS